jgi:DNA repair protein RecO (recombination protein O)
MIAHLHDPDAAGELVARFELLVLEELGFGLDLSCCAATGRRDDLVYVSPKSGRAVSRAAGEPWHDKMLALPAFLCRGTGVHGDAAAVEEAFCLTGFFLTRHVYEPRGIREPDERGGFRAALSRHFAHRAAVEGTAA